LNNFFSSDTLFGLQGVDSDVLGYTNVVFYLYIVFVGINRIIQDYGKTFTALFNETYNFYLSNDFMFVLIIEVCSFHARKRLFLIFFMLQQQGVAYSVWSSSTNNDPSHTDLQKYIKCQFPSGDTIPTTSVCSSLSFVLIVTCYLQFRFFLFTEMT
jgi:hypothetical protein